MRADLVLYFCSCACAVRCISCGGGGPIRVNCAFGTAVPVCAQDFIICIEMFIAAIVHHKMYNYKDYLSGVPVVTRARLARSRVTGSAGDGKPMSSDGGGSLCADIMPSSKADAGRYGGDARGTQSCGVVMRVRMTSNS